MFGLGFTTVDHVPHAWDGYGGLGDVCRENYFASVALGGRVKNALLLGRREGGV